MKNSEENLNMKEREYMNDFSRITAERDILK